MLGFQGLQRCTSSLSGSQSSVLYWWCCLPATRKGLYQPASGPRSICDRRQAVLQKSNNKVESDVPTLFCRFQITGRTRCWVQDALEENKKDCWELRNCFKKKMPKQLQCFNSFGKFFFLPLLLFCSGSRALICLGWSHLSWTLLLNCLFFPLTWPASLPHHSSVLSTWLF